MAALYCSDSLLCSDWLSPEDGDLTVLTGTSANAGTLTVTAV